MLFKTIKKVLDSAIAARCAGGSRREVILAEMKEHLVRMSREHRKDAPAIPYNDPVCRLAYLYEHVAANATLFEWVILTVPVLKKSVESRAGKTLRVCDVGGGPGSELLGLGKFSTRKAWKAAPPAEIEFALLDQVAQWGESWTQLAKATKEELGALLPAGKITIAPSFYTADVRSAKSCEGFGWLFGDIEIIVYNYVIYDYVISENLEHLTELQETARLLAQKASRDCVFVFIDRNEYDDRINAWLDGALPTLGLRSVHAGNFGGAMSEEEQIADLGDYLEKLGGGAGSKYSPRVSFFTKPYRNPTVFYRVAMPV